MRIFDPDPERRWLFAMTHPDDELSILAWMRRLVEVNAPVYVCWVHSTPTREAEARKVAEQLGVPQTRLHFFGAADGGVRHELPTLSPRFADWLAHCRPDVVCCGAFEQGHLDHDAVNLLVNLTFQGPVYEIPFYHHYTSRVQTINRFSTDEPFEVLELTPSERRLKIRMAKRYPSTNIWSVLFWYEVHQSLRFKPVELAKTERMRLQTHRRYDLPHAREQLVARVVTHPKWREWVCSIEPMLAPDGTPVPLHSK